MSNISIALERINSLHPLDVVMDDAVHRRFVDIYDTITRSGNGEAVYEKESRNFQRIISENDYLQKCTPFSIFTSFIDLAVCGLSAEPGVRAQCYLLPRSYQVPVEGGRPKYEYRCNLTISGYGELVLRMNCGQIRYADNPVIVYDNDEFSFSEQDGRKSVSYKLNYPHVSGHVVAAFMRITRIDGSIDYAVMLEEDWDRLKNYSGKNNRRWDDASKKYIETPNALYSAGTDKGIDTGFLASKLIKHAFKAYPKVKIGNFTMLETEAESPQDLGDIYGIAEEEPVQQKPQAFGNAPDMTAGVQITPAMEDDGAF